MPDEPDRDRTRSTEAAEDARRRLDRSEDRFAQEREEEREIDLVREQMRRHDRDLKQNGSS